MQIITAKNIGLCFGVERAIGLSEKAAAENGTVYTLGELIHNDDVIADLAKKGITAREHIADIPEGATVIIRSHGVGKDTYTGCKEKNFDLIDATCPSVKKIHDLVHAHYVQGDCIIILGRRDHPECIGINGWCGDSAVFVETAEEALALDTDKPLCVVGQTTFSSPLFDELTGIISNKYPKAQIYDTLCAATRARQQEAVELAKKCTRMVVVGGAHSSNTAKLVSVCGPYCKNIHAISKVSELLLEIMQCDDIIGVVGGASTPNWIIREVITGMEDLEKTMAGNPEETEKEVNAEATATVEEPVVAEAPAVAEVTAAEKPAAEKAEPMDNAEQSFAEAFESTLVRIRNGQILTGSVVQIVDGEVCVNIGYKSDGFIPRNEFSSDPDVNPADAVKIGDEIEVEVLKVNDGEGNVLLSHKNVESKKLWDKLMDDDEIQDKVFDAVGKEVVKGGLIASINGVRAFVPASQLSTKYVENIGDFVGKDVKLKVIEVDKARKRIVASHKAVMLAEAEESKKELWKTLVVGSKVQGVVRRLTDFGAFVDIGGIDGLVHVTDVAWGRVKHPSDVLSIGQEIEVLIRDVDVDRQRVSLGYKQLQPKPWTLADEKYPVGSVVEGKVVRIVPFGAFVALEPTIDGLIHISQVGVKRIEKVEDEINVGDVVKCKVLDVNPEAKRISLSRREVILEENPEIAEEMAREKEEHDRQAAEARAERQAAADARKQQYESEQSERRERRARRDEENNYQLPPVESATTSLADLFGAFNKEDK